ncbi:MAG: hypothetical protein EBY29_13610 [Planctomycetes bacterium]|nr:hypothetical protein [Planctomycetota bacterium]
MSSQIQSHIISSSLVANKKQSLESLRYLDLKEMASGSKIKGRSKMNKAQLVEALLKQWIVEQEELCSKPTINHTVTLKICRGLNIEVDCLVRCLNTSNSEYCNEHSHIYRFEKPDDCPVCMETISSRTETPLSCGHWVHKHCLVPTNLHMCPVCRQSMQPNEVRYVFGSNHHQHNSYAQNYYMPFDFNEQEQPHFQVIQQGANGISISSFRYLFGEEEMDGVQYHNDYEDDHFGNFDGVSDNVDNFYHDEHVSQNPFDVLDANMIDIIIREIEMRPNNNPYTNVPNDMTDVSSYLTADFHNYVFRAIELCSNMNNWNLDDIDIMRIRNRMLFNLNSNMDRDNNDDYPQDRNLLAINYNLFTVLNVDLNFLQRVDELVQQRIRAVYASEIPPLLA